MRAQSTPTDLPNSPAQCERIGRIIRRGYPGRSSHCVTVAVALRGPVDDGEMRHRLNALVHRHGALGCAFDPGPTHRPAGGEPAYRRQTVAGPDGETRWQRARDLADFEAQRPFALGEHPLVRALLLSTEDDRHLLVLNIDQLVGDAWSGNLLVDELVDGMGGRPLGRPDSYATVWRDRDDWLRGPDGTAAVERRRRHVTGAALRWPTRIEPDPDASSVVIERFTALDEAAAHGLKTRVREARGTLLAVGAMAVAVSIAEDPGQTLALLTTLAGREGPDEQATVGWFANDAVLRLPPRTGTVRDYATTLRGEVFAALSDHMVPFAALRSALAEGTPAGPSIAVVFLPADLNGGQRPEQRIGAAIARREGVSICPTAADIDFFLLEQPPPMSSTPRSALTVGISAGRDIAAAGVLDRLLQRWTAALTALAGVPWASTPLVDVADMVTASVPRPSPVGP
jgi:condensation domain-containing protein